eukprot:768429-Hanusia_phi.AAC.9
MRVFNLHTVQVFFFFIASLNDHASVLSLNYHRPQAFVPLWPSTFRITRPPLSLACSAQEQEWRIKRSELELELERKIEESFRVRKALDNLKLQREEEAKTLEWQIFLQKMQQDIEEPEVAPWEVADDLSDVVQKYFYNISQGMDDLGYMSADLGGNRTSINIVGMMDEMDGKAVKSAFDSVILDQRQKSSKKKSSLSGFLQGRSLGLKGTLKLDTAKAQGMWDVKRDAVEAWIRKEQTVLKKKNPLFAKKMLNEKLKIKTKRSVPWMEVMERVESLQYAILKDLQPQPRKKSFNFTAEDTLRMPKRNLNLNDELTTRTEGRQELEDDEKEMYEDIWFDLFDPDEQYAELSAMTKKHELRAMKVRNKIKRLQHSSEDMIQHANKWRKKEEKLPYESVKDFRKYVAEEFHKYKDQQAENKDGVEKPSKLIQYMLENVDKDDLESSYFGLLLVPQKDFIEGSLRRHGYDMGQIFLSPTEIEEDSYRWAELDYVTRLPCHSAKLTIFTDCRDRLAIF